MRGRAEDYNEWDDILRVNNDNAKWDWNTVFIFKEMENNSRLKINIIVKKAALMSLTLYV